MKRLRYTDWNILERTDDRITVRGPKGYVRLRRTITPAKPFDRWVITVKWEGAFLHENEPVSVVTREELWETVETAIDSIQSDKRSGSGDDSR